MKSLSALRCPLAAIAGWGALLAAWPSLGRADDTLAVAVSSRVSNDYVRAHLADGSIQPETFAFGKGGLWGGGVADPSIDHLKFEDIARIIVVPLTAQHYVSAKDPKTTKLLIMVYWGATEPPASDRDSAATAEMQTAETNLNTAQFAAQAAAAHTPSGPNSTGLAPNYSVAEAQDDLETAIQFVGAQDEIRNKVDIKNANILGYDSWWADTVRFQGLPFTFRDDMIRELEDPRYFVVLMAYDFQLMWKQKKVKLLWETRYSIRERGNDFDKQLAAMTRSAARYFGQDSKGLVHKELPQGHVEVGEPRPADPPTKN